MTQKEKIEYFKTALALCSIVADTKTCDLIIRNYEGILNKKGEFSLTDSFDIQCQIEKEYSKKKIPKVTKK